MRTSVTRLFYIGRVCASIQKAQYTEEKMIKAQYIEKYFMLQEKYFNICKEEFSGKEGE